MGYFEKHLIKGETVVYRTRLHWILLLRSIIIDVALIACAIAMFVHVFRAGDGQPLTSNPLIWVAISMLFVSTVILGWGLMLRNSTEMVVTTKHVMIKTGLMARSTNEMILS